MRVSVSNGTWILFRPPLISNSNNGRKGDTYLIASFVDSELQLRKILEVFFFLRKECMHKIRFFAGWGEVSSFVCCLA